LATKLKNQVLRRNERQKIRSDLYSTKTYEDSATNNKKINFFKKYTRGKKVLDLGSVDHFEENFNSKHWLFKALSDSAEDITGLDYYEDGVKSLVKKGYNIVIGDAQNFSFNETFDVVTAGDLIEHLPNLDGFLSSVSKSLNSGGVLVLSTPNPWCWKYLSCHLFYERLTPLNKEHVSWFCTQTLINLLERYGFIFIEKKYSSLRFYENLMPLPQKIKHTTLNITFKLDK